jgi:hypothetical protein
LLRVKARRGAPAAGIVDAEVAGRWFVETSRASPHDHECRANRCPWPAASLSSAEGR